MTPVDLYLWFYVICNCQRLNFRIDPTLGRPERRARYFIKWKFKFRVSHKVNIQSMSIFFFFFPFDCILFPYKVMRTATLFKMERNKNTCTRSMRNKFQICINIFYFSKVDNLVQLYYRERQMRGRDPLKTWLTVNHFLWMIVGQREVEQFWSCWLNQEHIGLKGKYGRLS